MQRLGTRSPRVGALIVLAGACGCFPAVMHGAHVEDGWIAGVTAASTSGDTHTEGDEGGIYLRQAMIGPFVGYGSASSSPAQPGYYIGAVVPVVFPFAQIDAYLELPPALTRPVSTGVGFTASAESVHGYAMFGADFDRTTSWYVAGGYGSRQASDDYRTPSPVWFGNAGIVKAYGYLRTQLFVEYAAGRIPGSCFDDPVTSARTCDQGRRGRAFSAGISLGRQQHNAGNR